MKDAETHAFTVTNLIGQEGAAALMQWPPKGLEVLDSMKLPLLNTLILLCSGTTVTWAHHCLIHGDREGLTKGLWLTILLGLRACDALKVRRSEPMRPDSGGRVVIERGEFPQTPGDRPLAGPAI